MATRTWKASPVDSYIGNSSNWTMSGGPFGPTNNAVIGASSINPSTGTTTVANLTVNSGGVVAGGTWNRSGTGTLSLSGTVTGGSIAHPGTVNSGGAINPADVANPPVFGGEITMAPGSVLTSGAVFNGAVIFSGLTGARTLVSAKLLDDDSIYILSNAPTITQYMTEPGYIQPGEVWEGTAATTGTRKDCSQFNARKRLAAYYGDPDSLQNGKVNVPAPASVLDTADVDYDDGELVCVYSGGSVAPDITKYSCTGGEIVTFDNDNNIYLTPGTTSFTGVGDTTADGTFAFSGLTSLTSLTLQDGTAQNVPIVAGCTALQSIVLRCSTPGPTMTGTLDCTNLSALTFLSCASTGMDYAPVLTGATAIETINLNFTGLTAFPNLTGLVNLKSFAAQYCPTYASPSGIGDCVLLEYLELGYTNMSDPPPLAGLVNLYWLAVDGNCTLSTDEVDNIFIWAAANLTHTPPGGNGIVLGNTNAPVSSASADARASLVGWGWNLTYNT